MNEKRSLRNVIFTLSAIIAITIGIAFLITGVYMYYDMKKETSIAQAAADNVIANRDINFLENRGLTELQLNWMAKADLDPFSQGEAIGKLLIPAMDAELPIISGADPDSLNKGVGHMTETKLPLENGQTVLSGHRDTIFRGIGELELGDKFIVQLPYGDFEYEIVETYVTSADDLTVIVPHNEETLTVTTCYPFNYIGYAPDRYIMNAKPTFDMSELDELKDK